MSLETQEARTPILEASRGQKQGTEDLTLWRQIFQANLSCVPVGNLLEECMQALDDPHFSDERGNVLANIASDRASRDDV